MMFLDRGIRQGLGVLVLLWVVPAAAQENLYGSKSTAQIFASDCAICHKTPQGLSKAGGPLGLGLEGFLREHYTASKETAAAMAKYIQSVDTGPAAPDRKRSGTAAKPAAKKPADAKAGDTKPAAPVGETKTETKPAEAKPAEKPPEAKPAEPAKPEKSE